MSSRVHRLVKFIPFIMHLNDFPCVILFYFSIKYNDIAFHKKGILIL